MGREHYQARNKHLFHLEAVEASYIKLVNGLLRETLHASIVLLRDGLIVAPVPTEILLVRLLTRSRGVTVLVGPPDTGGLLSMVQALQYYLFTAHAPGILDLSCFPFFFFFFNEQPPDQLQVIQSFAKTTQGYIPLALRSYYTDNITENLRLAIIRHHKPQTILIRIANETPAPLPHITDKYAPHFN